MFKLSLHSLWSHKRRLISTCIAVILGVAFMAGTFTLTNTINKGFDDLFATGFDGTDAVVRGPVLYKSQNQGGTHRDLLSEDTIAKVRALPQVAAAEGTIATTQIAVIDTKDTPMGGAGPPTIISDWIPDSTLNPYHVVEGHAPTSGLEITMNKASVKKGGFHLGQKVKLATPKGNIFPTLVGITKFGNADSSGGVIGVQSTLAGAQALIGETHRIDTVVARAKAGTSPDQLVAAIDQAQVSPMADVVTGQQAAAELSQELKGGFVTFFSTILLIFAIIALVVGLFIISNTFNILVAQRTKELALLRAIGASRRQVLGSVLIEATGIGLVSSLLGLLAGVGIAAAALGALSAVGFDLPGSGVMIDGPHALFTLIVGLLITLGASIFPAIKATRVPPIAAMRDVAIDTSGRSWKRAAVGALVLVLGVISTLPAFKPDPQTKVIPGVGAGLGLIVLAVILLAPSFARPLSWLIGSPLPKARGITGRLARENAMRSPSRTASTASALIIGVMLVVFITAFADSAQTSISNSISGGFRGDYIIQPVQRQQGGAGVSPKITKQLAAVPGVSVVAPATFLPVQLTLPDGSKPGDFINGIEPTSYSKVFKVKMTSGRLLDLSDGHVFVDRQIARAHDLKVGQTVHMLAGEGGRKLTVQIAGISNDPVLLGDWTLTTADSSKLSATPTVTFVGLKLDAGRTVDGMRAPLKKALKDYPTLKLQDRDQFTGSIVDTLQTILDVVYGLLAMSIIIALIGIANTLSLSIHERTRELGLLRATGMSRSQLRSSVRWEAAIVALMGTAVGVAIGVFGSFTMVKALVNRGFTDYELPLVGGLSLAVIVVIALGLGVLAAARPAAKAAKLNVLDAIATE